MSALPVHEERTGTSKYIASRRIF